MPDIEWECSGIQGDNSQGINVPVLHYSLDEVEMEQLRRSIDPLGPSDCHGMDIYMATVECVQSIINRQL